MFSCHHKITHSHIGYWPRPNETSAEQSWGVRLQSQGLANPPSRVDNHLYLEESNERRLAYSVVADGEGEGARHERERGMETRGEGLKQQQ